MSSLNEYMEGFMAESLFSSTELGKLYDSIQRFLCQSIATFESIHEKIIVREIKEIARKYGIVLSASNPELTIPGFYYKYVPSDGICGYHAIAEVIYGRNNFSGYDLRKNIEAQIRQNISGEIPENNTVLGIKEKLEKSRAKNKALLNRIVINESKNIGEFFGDIGTLQYIAQHYNLCFLIYDTKNQKYIFDFISPNTYSKNNYNNINEINILDCENVIYLLLNNEHYTLMEQLPNFNLNFDIRNRFIKKSPNLYEFHTKGLETPENKFEQAINNFREKLRFFFRIFDKIIIPNEELNKKTEIKNILDNLDGISLIKLAKKKIYPNEFVFESDSKKKYPKKEAFYDQWTGKFFNLNNMEPLRHLRNLKEQKDKIIDLIPKFRDTFIYYYEEFLKQSDINIQILFNLLYLNKIFECLNGKIKILIKSEIFFSWRINPNEIIEEKIYNAIILYMVHILLFLSSEQHIERELIIKLLVKHMTFENIDKNKKKKFYNALNKNLKKMKNKDK
jgi:hypothetical protein